MFRLINLPRTLNAPAPRNHHVTINLSASKSWIKSIIGRPIGTWGKESETEQRSVYSNKHGEEVRLSPIFTHSFLAFCHLTSHCIDPF